MKLKRLRILRMPGFPDGGPSYEDLADGLNVVVGPNASGKTTTCEAIRGLLWEGHLAGRRPVLIESTWTDDGPTVRIDLEADNRVFLRNDRPAQPDGLPPADLARCFTITIDDLFEINDTDRAKKIVHALAGGYDIREIRGRITDFRKNQARTAQKQLVDAGRQVRSVQQAHEALRREESDLSALADQARDAKEAGRQLGKIESVRGLNALHETIEGVSRLLEGFPPDMDRLGGRENESLATFRSDIGDAENRLQDALGDIEQQEARQTEVALPEGGIASERLDEQERHLAALKEAERDVRDARGDVAQAEKKRRSALRSLAAIDADRIDAIDTASLDAIETLHRDRQTAHEKRSAVEARLALIGEGASEGDVEVLAQGMGILREWLEAGPASVHDTSAKRNAELVLVLSALLGVTALTIALTVSPWWAALLVPAAAAVVVARRGRANPPSDRRAERQAAFERTGLDAPDSWSPDAVGRRITDLEHAIARARQAEQRAGERRSLEQQLEQLAADTERLDAQRAELAEQLGLEADIGTLPLTDLATNLRAYREASEALASAQEDATAADDERAERLGRVNAFLGEYGLEECGAYDTARTAFDGLKKRPGPTSSDTPQGNARCLKTRGLATMTMRRWPNGSSALTRTGRPRPTWRS